MEPSGAGDDGQAVICGEEDSGSQGGEQEAAGDGGVGLQQVVGPDAGRGRGGSQAATARRQEHVHVGRIHIEPVAHPPQQDVQQGAGDHDPPSRQQEDVEVEEEESVAEKAVEDAGQNEQREEENLRQGYLDINCV